MTDDERIEQKLDTVLRLQKVIAAQLIALAAGGVIDAVAVQKMIDELQYYGAQVKDATDANQPQVPEP